MVFGWGYNQPWQLSRLLVFPSEWKHRQQAEVPATTASASAVRSLLVQALSFTQAPQLQVQSFKLMFPPTSGRLSFLNASVYEQSTVEIAIITIPSPAHTWISQHPFCREERECRSKKYRTPGHGHGTKKTGFSGVPAPWDHVCFSILTGF